MLPLLVARYDVMGCFLTVAAGRPGYGVNCSLLHTSTKNLLNEENRPWCIYLMSASLEVIANVLFAQWVINAVGAGQL